MCKPSLRGACPSVSPRRAPRSRLCGMGVSPAPQSCPQLVQLRNPQPGSLLEPPLTPQEKGTPMPHFQGYHRTELAGPDKVPATLMMPRDVSSLAIISLLGSGQHSKCLLSTRLFMGWCVAVARESGGGGRYGGEMSAAVNKQATRPG